MVKMMLFFLLILLGAVTAPLCLRAQDDLLRLLDSQTVDRQAIDVAAATFKGTRIINGHSVETGAGGDLQFLISHRFGTLNSGAYHFFGLDQSTIRLALEYGLTNRLMIGIGRSSFEKTYDSFAKYRLVRQSSGARSVPVSLTAFTSVAAKTLRFPDPSQTYSFSTRLSYTYQLLIARKFSDRTSLQLSPTLVHRNLVESRQEENRVYAIGIGGRQKLSNRIALTAEYFYLLPGPTASRFSNSLSAGLDIQTGGHVFQLHVTNSQGMVEKLFIPETLGTWSRGDLYFGFNIVRSFSLKPVK
ncbi:DUF5777 family beta-barrel protein [soil metagenome]